MRFPGEGNISWDKKRGDLIVRIEQTEHPVYRREGDNLIYRHKLSLKDALTSAPIEFKTLDGEIIKFSADEIISPTTEKVFEGKGMPIYSSDPLSPLLLLNDRGDFILRFQIDFPPALSDSQKQRLAAVIGHQ